MSALGDTMLNAGGDFVSTPRNAVSANAHAMHDSDGNGLPGFGYTMPHAADLLPAR